MIINSSSVGSLWSRWAEHDSKMVGNAGIPLHERQEGSLEDIRSIELVCVMAQKEDNIINELAYN